MKKELYDLASWGIDTAKAAGAGDCRININASRRVQISYRERKPENIKESSTKSLSLDIFVNGRYSSMSTSDLRKPALKDFIVRAVSQTKILAEDPFRSLTDPKYYQGRQSANLDLVDPEYHAWNPESRHAFVKTIEEACLSKGGDKVISVTAGTSDNYFSSLLMTSNGFDGYNEGTFFSGNASMTAKDLGDRKPMEYGSAAAVHRKDLAAPETIGEEAASRALALLGGKKIKTETIPIIIENRVADRIGSGLLDAMTGRAIQQKQSFLAEKRGQPIASNLLTLIDDPLLKRGFGSFLFDGDGFPAQKRIMIDAGILKEFYIDWYYSRKLGWEPTTGSTSNLIIPPGKRSVAEIMKDLGRGILITGFIGGNSNSTTGDVSLGIVGRLFEDGIPIQAVSEMNIADNHLKLWTRLIEAANDPYRYSSGKIPSLVFRDVVVSGI